MADEVTIAVPLELARLIDKVFLPANPNKMRKAAPEVRDAALRFRQMVQASGTPSRNAVADTSNAKPSR